MPLSTFSTAPELAGLLRGADVRVLLSARSYRNHDYVATLAAAVPELDLGAEPPLLAASMPALRHLAFADPDGDVPAPWTVATLARRGSKRSATTCWPPPRPR